MLSGNAQRSKKGIGRPSNQTMQQLQRENEELRSALRTAQAHNAAYARRVATLQQLEQRFRTLIEQAPLAIAMSREGTIIYANAAYRRLFAVDGDDELAGWPVVKQIAPQCRAQLLDRVRRRELGLPITEEFDSIGLRQDGSQFPFTAVTRAVELADGPAVVVFCIDMTEHQHTTQLLLESERLRTVAGLAAGVAHEINNPLAGMVQNAQAALRRVTVPMPASEEAAQRHGTTFEIVRRVLTEREIPEMLESIRTSGMQASKIVRNLLSYTHSQQSKAPVCMESLIDRALELAANDVELKGSAGLGSVKIVREISSPPPAIECHESQLQQALLNLLRNAVSAMRHNPAGRPPVLTLRAFGCDGHATIEVEDNGDGIPPQVRSRLFEPFVTTKQVGEGTGLGLFVCYHIITANHRGWISVQSTPAGGACFRICLPIAVSKE